MKVCMFITQLRKNSSTDFDEIGMEVACIVGTLD